MPKSWTTTSTHNSIAGIAGYGNINSNSTITVASHGSISLQNALAGSTSTTIGSSKIAIQKTSYHVLGEDVEVVNGWYDTNLVMVISTLNVLKKPYYDELLKNGYTFPKEIEDFLKVKFRDILIDEIFN